jgi:flagellar basal-body rod protein FlgC
MSIFRTIDISASALTAQTLRMDVIAQNVANANTTRTEDGTPYQRKTTILQEIPNNFERMMEDGSPLQEAKGGVVVSQTLADESPFQLVYDPSHPDADEAGYVRMPNVDILREYVDMISASRSYEANVTVMNVSKRMAMKALEIGR